MLLLHTSLLSTYFPRSVYIFLNSVPCLFVCIWILECFFYQSIVNSMHMCVHSTHNSHLTCFMLLYNVFIRLTILFLKAYIYNIKIEDSPKCKKVARKTKKKQKSKN